MKAAPGVLERIGALSESDQIVCAANDRKRRRSVFDPPPFCAARKRNHRKRHSVNRERSREDAVKAKLAKDRAAAGLARKRLIATTMADYFAGRVPDLKRIAHLLEG